MPPVILGSLNNLDQYKTEHFKNYFIHSYEIMGVQFMLKNEKPAISDFTFEQVTIIPSQNRR